MRLFANGLSRPIMPPSMPSSSVEMEPLGLGLMNLWGAAPRDLVGIVQGKEPWFMVGIFGLASEVGTSGLFFSSLAGGEGVNTGAHGSRVLGFEELGGVEGN